MSIQTEDQDLPSSTNLEGTDQAENDITVSDEPSLDDEWAAALAEQEQGETTVPEPQAAASEPEAPLAPAADTEAAPTTEASLDDEWTAALAEQEQGETAHEPQAAASEPEAPLAPAADTEAAPTTEASLDDEWTAALAEQEQGETTVPEPQAAASEPEAPLAPAADMEAAPTTEASLDDEWAAALAEQEQGETAPEPQAAASEPEAPLAPAADTEAAPTTEASLDDEWAAALAEQDQGTTAPAVSEPQDTTIGEAPAKETSLDDEWAAALAEQEQGEAVPEPQAAANEAEVQTPPAADIEGAPTTSVALEDESAAALAEQEQGETTPEPQAAVSKPEAQLPPTADTEAAPATEASLDDEWAAALAEQSPTDTDPAQEGTITSENNVETQANGPTPNLADSPNSSTEDEDSVNDWAAVLEEPTQKEISPTEQGSAPEESDQVVMNWPGAGSAQSTPQTTSTEWKPKKLSAESEESPQSDLPSPEEMLAASFAAKEQPTSPADDQNKEAGPPPELALGAVAAQASVEAAVLGAEELSAILQIEPAQGQHNPTGSGTELTNKNQQAADPQAKASEPTAASETQELASAPPNPKPPVPDVSPQSTGEAPDRFRRPFFTGTGGSLFGMFTMNTLLTLLTFGVYSFWGRMKIRRYLHSQTKFADARLAFHGTGAELFKGWMKAVVVFGIPYSALNVAGALQTDATFQWGVNIVAGLFIFCFIPIAIVGSHRYRMSRTSWRGIYFSFRNSAKNFFTLYLKGTFLSIVTLGIYYPVFENAKRAFLVSGTHFGSREFGFDGLAKELGSIYFKALRVLVLALVTAEAVLIATSFLSGKTNPNQMIDIVFWTTIALGSMVVPFVIGLWYWFQATKQRYMWSHTTFGPARFRATMTGKDLFELKFTNLLLLISTLGLAWPWVQTRNLQFLYYHVGLQGPLNLKQVVQEASTASPMGEELAGFFDTGFDLG